MSTAPTEVAAQTAHEIVIARTNKYHVVYATTALVNDIAAAIDTAVLTERERCAGIAEQWLIANLENEPHAPGTMVGQHLTARNIAAAIREGKS